MLPLNKCSWNIMFFSISEAVIWYAYSFSHAEGIHFHKHIWKASIQMIDSMDFQPIIVCFRNLDLRNTSVNVRSKTKHKAVCITGIKIKRNNSNVIMKKTCTFFGKWYWSIWMSRAQRDGSQFRVLDALAEDPDSVPNTHIKGLTTISNSIFRVPKTHF